MDIQAAINQAKEFALNNKEWHPALSEPTDEMERLMDDALGGDEKELPRNMYSLRMEELTGDPVDENAQDEFLGNICKDVLYQHQGLIGFTVTDDFAKNTPVAECSAVYEVAYAFCKGCGAVHLFGLLVAAVKKIIH